MKPVSAFRAMPVRRRVVGALLVVALVVLSVIAAVGFIGPPVSGRADEGERQEVQLATADAVTALMTFRPDTLTAAQETVGDRLTGRLLLEFRSQGPGVVLPTATHGRIHLRCVTQPDSAQAALLDRLGIVLPKRMRLAEPEWPTLVASA